MKSNKKRLTNELSERLERIRNLNISNPCDECLVQSGCSILRLAKKSIGYDMTKEQMQLILSCHKYQLYLGYKALESINPDNILHGQKIGFNLLDICLNRVERYLR